MNQASPCRIVYSLVWRDRTTSVASTVGAFLLPVSAGLAIFRDRAGEPLARGYA
jgi:hypothetical protein